MTVKVADVHARVQRLNSVVKMAIVLDEFTTEEQQSVLRFLWSKGLGAKDIHKERFPVYCRKCSSLIAFHNWVEKFSQERSSFADGVRPGHPVDMVTEAKTPMVRISTHW
jgi:hypothetical protein